MTGMAAQMPPSWLLISILFSNIRLTPALAVTLHEAALDLHRRRAGARAVAGDLATGRVRSLGRSMSLGAIAGPAFEADLETERGKGRVRFLLTRVGIELAGAAPRSPPKRPRYLN